jgi:hypothetical protein
MTSILDRLLIMRCPSATGADFMSALKYLPTLCSIESRDDATPLRLLIVDNIGANYWYCSVSIHQDDCSSQVL